VEATTGNVVSRREYSPYGDVLSETGTVHIDHGFTGHFFDEVFKLHHAPARVYDGALGRWLTPDPLPGAQGLPESTNLYSYVGNNPVNYTDPYGLCAQRSGNNNRRGASGSGGGKKPPTRIANSASPADPGDGAPIRGPRAGGGAKIENLSTAQRARIQEIADRYGLEISVVGSRASGKANRLSDWDYIIKGGNSKSRSSALYKLPKNSSAIKDGNFRPGSEILRNVDVDPNRPYISFRPSK